MAGKGPSRRFSVSGLLVDGDLIDLDQPAESMLLKEDGFLMDSDLDTEIFKASPPKPSVEAPLQVHKNESLVETKTKRRRNKMRSSMAWDQAFQVDEDALFLRDPLDPPLAPEPSAPPRTIKRPPAIDIPTRKSIQDAEARPPLRARTPDPTPFAELQSNTPIPDAEPSPVLQQQSGGKRKKEKVQESMAWNRAFQEENQGALLTDDLPLTESPVLRTRKKSPRKGTELQESSDSCTTSVGHSRQHLNSSSMAWDRAFRSGEGVLEMGNVEQSSEAWVARSSDRVSQSVFSSVESLNTEASTSSLAGTAPEDEAESGGRKGARLQNSSEGGLVGHVMEKTSTPVKGTPTKGERRRKLAGLHRPTSTAVAIEAAIQHGTRLRLPGRYNPNPVPPPRSKPKTPEPARKPSKQSPLPRKSPNKSVLHGGSTADDSVRRNRSAKETDGLLKKSTETEGAPSRTGERGLSAGKSGYEQGLGPQEMSMFEALQAQLAATQRERDALKAELEASTGERTSPKDAPAAYPQGAGKATNQDARDSEILGQTSKRNGGTPAAAEAGGSVGAHAASGLRRPQTRSTTGALPRGSLPQPAGTAQIRARVSPKISLAAASGNGNGTVEAQEAAPSVSAPGARPSFLKKPTAKRDFFHAPTTAALPSPAVTSAVGSTSVASPARHSKGSAGGSSGAPSTTEALKVPSVRRGATSSAVEGASAKPSPVPAYAKPAEKPQISESSQSSLPRYQSLLRKPSASGQSRTLKPGAFNASAIQAACAVPLPSSPACKLDVASPSPARKPGARTLSGVSSPAASRLRRSADKPVAASSSGETTGTPQKGADSRGIPLSKAAPQGEPPVANAFLSKLAAASGGGLSRIPSLGTSRLKPPGAKAPGLTSVPPRLVTSALPRPSAIDPALVAAACAAPLPGSPKPSKPETLLPRGIPGALEAPRGPSHSGSAGVSKLPTPTGRSLLRPPSSVTTALVRAACVVPLPPSPRNAKLPGPSPGPKEESLEMEVDTVPKCKDGPLAKAEKGRAGKEEGGAVDKGLEGIKLQVADVMEDGVLETVMDAESEGPVTAMNSLSSSVDNRGALPLKTADTCPSSEPSVEEAAPPRSSPTEKSPVATEAIPDSPISCSANQTPKFPSPETESDAANSSEAPNTFPETFDDEPTSSVSYPSLQLPPDSCSHTRRFSKKPNLPTIYSPARGLFTVEGPGGDHDSVNRPLRSPVARALFSSKLGRAARVVTEGSVPAGVEDGIPVSSENGIPVSLEDGVPVNMEDGIPVGAGGGTSGSLEKEFLGGSADGDPLRPGSGIPAEQARGTATGTEGSGFEKEGEALEEANGEVQRESLPGDRPKNEETAPNTKSVTEAESCSENANELSVIEPEQRSTEECPGEGTEPLAEPASQPHSYPGHSDQPSVAPLAECSVKKAELTEECPGEGTESLADPKSEPRSYSSEIDQPPVILLVEPPVETPDQAEQPGLCPSIVAPEGEAISGEEQPATSGQGLAEEAVSVSVFNGEPAGLTEEAMTVSVLNDWEPTAPGQGLTEEAVTASVTAEGAASNHETGHVLETSVPHHQKLAVSARQGPDASDLDELTVSTKEGSGSAPEVLALPFPVPELRALSGEAPKSPPPGPHSERVAPSVELCPDEEASLVADQEILVQSNQESPAVPCQDTQLPRSKEAPGVTTDEAPAAAEPEKPTDGPEELSEPEGIPPPEQSPEPAAAGGGVMGLFARMRARQAAVVAMLDSPVKSQPSPDPESAADGRLERPGDIPRERLEQPGIKEEGPGVKEEGPGVRKEQSGVKEEGPGVKEEKPGGREEGPGVRKEQPGVKEERPGVKEEQPGVQEEGPGVKEEGCGVKEEEPEVRKEQPGGKEEHSRVRVEVETESRAESGDKEEGPGVHPRTENEGKKGEASDRGNQPGLELKREIEQSRDQSETEQRPGSASEEKELKGGEERNEAGSGSGDRSQDTDDPLGPENVTGGPDRAERSEAKEGADVRLSEVVSLPLAGFSLPETKDAKCVEVETSAEDPGNVVTVLGVSGPNETSPVASPGVKSPVSAAWEEAWFGTPVSKPGLAQPGAGLERTCLTEGKEQSPGDGTGGKETGRETQSTANEDAASVSLEPPTSADVSARRDDACESGDDVSSAPGVTAYGVDGAPKAQSGDSLSTEASSTGGFTPRASPARGGRGSGRKPSPKTPSPILSLAIPPFESPQTPVDEPRQTLESQFEDEAGKGEMDAQWDACVARFGGRKRTSPASLPQGPPGRRTPMRHSAEDLWSYLAPGRNGSTRLTPTRVASPVSVLTRTPGRLKNPMSESAPGLAGLMQSVMDASARKEGEPGAFGAGSSPVARPRGIASGRRKKPVLSPVNVSWDGDELDARIREIEAAGEGALTTKSGRVQASPPDKKEEAPANPYSPVKKKECGPFDCTKKSASF